MSAQTYESLKKDFSDLKNEFEKSYRCVNRCPLPSAQTQAKHINNLVRIHNDICDILSPTLSQLTTTQSTEIENLFTNLKNKFDDLLRKVEISNRVPKDFETHFDLHITEETVEPIDEGKTPTATIQSTPSSDLIHQDIPSTSHTQTRSKICEISQPLSTKTLPPIVKTKMDSSLEIFMNLATKLLPDFDSSPEHLPKFIKALDILEQIKGTHETIAVLLIKSKISGKGQRSISELTTITSIKECLSNTIKGENSVAIYTKLLSVSQMNKSGSDFIKEIEILANKLEQAYISDGMPNKLANEFATQNTVKAITKGARSEKVKTVMMAATFSNISEVTTKFISVNTEVEEARINYLRNKQHQNNYRGSRRGRKGYQQNQGHNGNKDQNQRKNYRSSNRYNKNHDGYGQNRNVRYVNNDSENELDPQQAQLGNQN